MINQWNLEIGDDACIHDAADVASTLAAKVKMDARIVFNEWLQAKVGVTTGSEF